MKRLIGLLAVPLFATSALAQSPPCGPYDEIVKSITAPKYGESRIAVGQTKTGAEGAKIAIEVFGAPRGKTFTILLVRPDGFACIIGAGDNLKTFPLPEEGADI